jgi:hypothetical protein
MVYMDMFNREDIFSRDLYPAYTSIVRGIRDRSVYDSVRNKLEKLRQLVRRTYKIVHDIGIYYRTTDIETIAGMIARVGYLAEDMEDLIDEILSERMPPGEDSEAFKQYLRRILYEVVYNIDNDVGALIEDIRNGDEYNIDYKEFEDELFKFLNGAERALKEIDSSLSEILRRI